MADREKLIAPKEEVCYCPLCDKHFEVRSNSTWGYCPDCGHHVVLRKEVADG